MRGFILALVCTGLLARSAFGQTVDCNTAQTTPELALCAEQDYRKSDAELNRIYDLAVAAIETKRADDSMTPAQRQDWKAALQKSQRTWISFRDADCNELTGWEWFGGTGAAAASWNCLSAKSQARSEELKDRYGVQ